MFTGVQVAVDSAAFQFDKLYSYNVPERLEASVKIGSRVLVPFGSSKRMGIVLGNCDGDRSFKEIIDSEQGIVIVDVRRQDEYDSGHIPGAVLLPNESIGQKQPEELPDLDQIILIYCRSGNRSRQAAQKLSDLGYTNVYEFGGILTWDGELTAEKRVREPGQ